MARQARRRIGVCAGLAAIVAVAVALTLATGGANAGGAGAGGASAGGARAGGVGARAAAAHAPGSALDTSAGGASGSSAQLSNALKLTVGAPLNVHPIRPGFLGLSIEYPSIEAYAGTNPKAINPVLVQLIRNIAPNQSPVLRIGGDSTDWEWWPVQGMQKPGGVKYALTPTWIAVMKAVTEQLDARLILGVDLEANSLTLARAEANALVNGLGTQTVEALEPGNEPELYGSWAWYHTASGDPVKGRPSSWDIQAFERQLAQVERLLRPTPLAGPAAGSAKWIAELRQFLGAAPYLKLITLHKYPLQQCYTAQSEPTYPTIAHMLSARASRGLAGSVARYIRMAHARGIPIRIDEMNTNSCGAVPKVTESFGSALWAADTLFAMAAAGADGVNVHTYQGSTYQLFGFGRSHGRWSAAVEPEYYGLMLFALAAPPGSRLLGVSGPATREVRAWATSAPDGQVRVTVINDDLTHAHTVAIKLGGAATAATLIRLRAPRVGSRSGVSLGGLGFGTRTTTGRPSGRQRSYAVTPTGGEYVVTVPSASAALLIR